MSASGQDQNGLGAQPASAVGDLPQPVLIDGKERWRLVEHYAKQRNNLKLAKRAMGKWEDSA